MPISCDSIHDACGAAGFLLSTSACLLNHWSLTPSESNYIIQSCYLPRVRSSSPRYYCYGDTMDEAEDDKKQFASEAPNEEDTQPDPEEELLLDRGNGRVWLVKVSLSDSTST